MQQQWIGPVIAFFGALIGALLAGFAAARVNRAKMSADVQARWDAALLERSSDMAEAARSLRHHAEHFKRSKNQDALLEQLGEAQEKLRVSAEQLRLVGSRRVQEAAREVLMHAYSVRMLEVDGRDPRKDDFVKKPIDRLNDALQEFYRAVRVQLRAPDAEDVIHHDDLRREMTLGSLTMQQRSTQV
jgi:hypothetical protein